MDNKKTEDFDLLNGEIMDMGQLPPGDDLSAFDDFDLDDDGGGEKKRSTTDTKGEGEQDENSVARASAKAWTHSYSLLLQTTAEAFSGKENPRYGLTPAQKKEYEEISYQAALDGVQLMSATTMFIIASVSFAVSTGMKAWADKKEVKRKNEIKEKVIMAKAVDGTLETEAPAYIRKRYETHADGTYKYDLNGDYLASGMGAKPTAQEKTLIEKYRKMKYKPGAINKAVLKDLGYDEGR